MTARHIRLLGIVAAAGLGPSAVAGLVQEINLRFDPAVVIPDFDENGVSIDVPANAPPQFVITNLVVGLVIEHEWQGDVSVHLEHLGTGLGGFLLDRPGTSMWGGSSSLGYGAQDFGDVVTNTPLLFDDAADASINLYAGPMSGPGTGIDSLLGSYRPTDPLAIHTGGPGGIWRFTFLDQALGNTGAVHHISMLIEYELIPTPGSLPVLVVAGLLTPPVRRRKRRQAMRVPYYRAGDQPCPELRSPGNRRRSM